MVVPSCSRLNVDGVVRELELAGGKRGKQIDGSSLCSEWYGDGSVSPCSIVIEVSTFYDESY